MQYRSTLFLAGGRGDGGGSTDRPTDRPSPIRPVAHPSAPKSSKSAPPNRTENLEKKIAKTIFRNIQNTNSATPDTARATGRPKTLRNDPPQTFLFFAKNYFRKFDFEVLKSKNIQIDTRMTPSRPNMEPKMTKNVTQNPGPAGVTKHGCGSESVPVPIGFASNLF